MPVWVLLAGSVLMASVDMPNFPKLTGPYLGQNPPGMVPELFAPV